MTQTNAIISAEPADYTLSYNVWRDKSIHYCSHFDRFRKMAIYILEQGLMNIFSTNLYVNWNHGTYVRRKTWLLLLDCSIFEYHGRGLLCKDQHVFQNEFLTGWTWWNLLWNNRQRALCIWNLKFWWCYLILYFTWFWFWFCTISDEKCWCRLFSGSAVKYKNP
jgi:hypothetical protein